MSEKLVAYGNIRNRVYYEYFREISTCQEVKLSSKVIKEVWYKKRLY